MSKLIDNIFDYETIRYVPIFYQNEWKSLYNSYKTNYFKEQNKIFNIYCTKKYDNKLNEYNKLKYMKKLKSPPIIMGLPDVPIPSTYSGAKFYINYKDIVFQILKHVRLLWSHY